MLVLPTPPEWEMMPIIWHRGLGVKRTPLSLADGLFINSRILRTSSTELFLKSLLLASSLLVRRSVRNP